MPLPPRPVLHNHALTIMLAGIAIVGPVVAYAGISVVWPESRHTVDVNTNPPVKFLQGSDYQTAANLSYASGFLGHDSNASFEITLSGLSGGNVTIDDYVSVTKGGGVSSYKMQLSTALAGNLTPSPTMLKIRLWTGGSPPTADGDAQVCGVLNLLGSAGNETTGGPCTASADMQILLSYGTDATGNATLKIRPSSIVYN